MSNAGQRIRGQVSPALLDKVGRLFRNDDAGVWVELLQNARRAGASIVHVEITEASGVSRVMMTDNGCGIQNFQNLLTLGGSDCNQSVSTLEDPAGMGFFALCHSEVEVHSGRKRTTLTPEVFLGKSDAEVVESDEVIAGTQIRFTRPASKAQLVAALQRVAEFNPIEVRLGEEVLSRHDFLEGAEHREWIDGVEIGIAPAFRHGWSYSDENWNFYGARLRHAFPCPEGWLTRDNHGRWIRTSLNVRFDVRDTVAVKLQLPDRRAIVEDNFLQSFEGRVLAAVYRSFQLQDAHALAFRDWKKARELGVVLPEAAPLMTTWHAASQDEFFEPIFGHPETKLLDGTSGVILVEDDIPNPHTLEGAIQAGATLGADLYKEHPAFQGYSWYDRLRLISSTSVLTDGSENVVWRGTGEARPSRIEIEVLVRDSENREQRLLLPALIHADSESINEPTFVVVSDSPWDGDGRPEPFAVTDFLMWATFCSSDNFGESDSWETQRDEYQTVIERVVSEYFGGARAALLTVLQQAIPWDAHTYLDQLGINEIRFRRGEGRRIWCAEIVDQVPASSPFDLCTIADISTGYFPESDCALLERPDCPTRFAATDDGAGTFHWVTDDARTFAEEMARAEQFGLSERFRLIMARLREAGIPYVRFDADGGEIADLARTDV
ncbi:MAG: hypothetical protein M1335_03080 [Chloroflexi bacterium]|nr:hypothetical protein [Chloroflexota bacterium]